MTFENEKRSHHARRGVCEVCARAEGAAQASARIRRELLAAQPRNLTELLSALDRICPKTPGP